MRRWRMNSLKVSHYQEPTILFIRIFFKWNCSSPPIIIFVWETDFSLSTSNILLSYTWLRKYSCKSSSCAKLVLYGNWCKFLFRIMARVVFWNLSSCRCFVFNSVLIGRNIFRSCGKCLRLLATDHLFSKSFHTSNIFT